MGRIHSNCIVPLVFTGGFNRPAKAELCTAGPSRIGTHITIETRRNPKRQTLFATPSTPRFCHFNLHMVFVSLVDIQSIRYSNIPTTWPQCNVFQQNQLTINLNPDCADLFTVPIRDKYACQLLGLSAGGKGRKALLAALAHVGKFRYGPNEPTYDYYRLSLAEKVLHLYFATFPPYPHNGGYVMFLKSKICAPANVDDVWLGRFNYYVHTKPPRRYVEEMVDENNTNKQGDMLAILLLPGIARRMKSLREKLRQANDE
ncbi:uncharacterized protein LOC125763567 [Anopheles funestus]|uniref:uncharacterized protein LOC125763567 n=1 Tax=Anopheles funestus TaxID=62324 RepID=UPI0020C6E8C8|nr:uncharacterized protein LOC125763567 [Anopheles funestus]